MAISNYAKALFLIAKEEKKIDTLAIIFTDFMVEIKSNPAWTDMMDSPMISFDKKAEMIDTLSYDVSFLSFLKMLAQKNRVHLLKEIYSEWKDLTRTYLKIAHLNIYSAHPISEENEERMKKVIQPMFPKHTISFHITVDPELLGGIKIVHQGLSLDRSIQRELEELYTTI